MQFMLNILFFLQVVVFTPGVLNFHFGLSVRPEGPKIGA